MKLPEDKKERTKILIMIILGGILALYGLISAAKPLVSNKKTRIAKMAELEKNLKDARRDIDDMMNARDVNDRNLREIAAMAGDNNYLAKPNLGNYLLGVSEIIKSHASKNSMEVDIQEIGRSEIPQGSRSSRNVFLSYTIRVTVDAGLHDLVRFLQDLEASNPYLCVSALEISGNPTDPEKHKVALDIQWPAWSDQEMGEKLCESIKASIPTNNTATAVENTGVVKPEEGKQ